MPRIWARPRRRAQLLQLSLMEKAKKRHAAVAPLCLLRQPVRGTRQELPGAVLFLPNLHDSDLSIGDLASSSVCETQRCLTTAVWPTTCTVTSGNSSDLTVAFRPMTPSMNLALSSSRASEWL